MAGLGTVTQFGGHSYIDLETVAQITNGTLAVEPTRITLTIPEPTPAPAANPAPQPAPVAEGLSREFARAAISELAEIREWRGAIGTILTYGVAVVGTWPQDYRAHVETDLAQVAVNASTSADQSALQLLRNEFGFMDQWADEVVTARQSLNANKSVDPNAMQKRPHARKSYRLRQISKLDAGERWFRGRSKLPLNSRTGFSLLAFEFCQRVKNQTQTS